MVHGLTSQGRIILVRIVTMVRIGWIILVYRIAPPAGRGIRPGGRGSRKRVVQD